MSKTQNRSETFRRNLLDHTGEVCKILILFVGRFRFESLQKYLRGVDKVFEIIQSDKYHKAANVVDKPGGGVQIWVCGVVASGHRF